MPITYNIETDGLYLQGIEKGIEKGFERGVEKGIEAGIEKGLTPAILNIMKKFPHYSDEEIADLLDAPLSLVLKIREQTGKS